MTIEEFGKTVKEKYPQYNDLSDIELGQKMIAKYPKYSDIVQIRPDKEKLKEELAMAEEEANKGFVRRFGRELVGKTGEILIKTPAKFKAS